jgi:hypothetical protein
VRDRVQGGDVFRRDGARTLARTIRFPKMPRSEGRRDQPIRRVFEGRW